jgi:hypothetical protein
MKSGIKDRISIFFGQVMIWFFWFLVVSRDYILWSFFRLRGRFNAEGLENTELGNAEFKNF